MLGDLIYEANDKDDGYRVLDTEGPKTEVTIMEKGTMKGGIEISNTVTYWSIPCPGGAYMLKAKEFL